MQFIATCPKGFESLLADELASFGTQRVRALHGQVAFEGVLADGLRACLWSRLASRIMVVLGRIDASDSDALYEGLSQIAWEDQLSARATFAIDAHGTNEKLRNTQFIALRSKDAISDRILAHHGARPQTDTAHPDVTFAVRISKQHATIAVDLSGEPLFRRGYEQARTRRLPIAMLRPDYAAALLAAGGWYRDARHAQEGRPATLIALYYGAGTVLAEAASQAADTAPGLLRRHWGFVGWTGHDEATWSALLDEAHERSEIGKSGAQPLLLACDPRPKARDGAIALSHSAGLSAHPRFIAPDKLGKTLTGLAKTTPLAACDLSWIEADELAWQAEALSLVSGLRGSRCSILTRDATSDAALGTTPTDTVDVIVGRDPQTIRSYEPATAGSSTPAHVSLPNPRGGAAMDVSVLVPASEQFARRLAKVAKQRSKWAQCEFISCYRVYDCDLPDYAVTIDLFEGSETPGRWLSIYEYAAPRSIDPALARERLLDAIAIAGRLLDVRPKDVFVRVRSHGRGGSQYADEHALRQPRQAHSRSQVPLPAGAHLIEEGGLTFEVNFTARLDCGIFLDHRETRSLVRELMKQARGSRRFLNLFCYTGTATCYAADGGARHTTSVDLSAPSLAWAKRNMDRNGFTGPVHEYVQADVIAWVGEQRHTRNRWDLIFCDVPTFSNSSRMRSASWDVQRDHAELLIGVSRLLTANGQAIFSCNLRSFKPDLETLAKAGVELEDISAKTIPEDFSRNNRIHHCYLLRRVRS